MVVGLPLTLKGERGEQARRRSGSSRRCGRSSRRSRRALRRALHVDARRGRRREGGGASPVRLPRLEPRLDEDRHARRAACSSLAACGGESSAPPPPTMPAPKVLRIVFPEGFTRAQMIDRVGAVRKIARVKRNVTMRMTARAYAAATAASPIPVQFRKDAHEQIEGFLFPATYAFFSNETGAAVRAPPAGRVPQGLAPRGHALRALEEPHAVRRPHHRVDDRAGGRRPARAQARRRRRLQPATGGHAASARCDASLRPRHPADRADHEGASPPRTPRTTRASRRGCRRRRSRTRACASMQAAAHPAKVDYIYFVRKPDCRSHFFTASAAEFEAYTREGLQC